MKNGKLYSATLVSLCPSKSVINSGVAAVDPCFYRTGLRICSKVLKSQENAYLERFHSPGRRQIKTRTKRGSKRRPQIRNQTSWHRHKRPWRVEVFGSHFISYILKKKKMWHIMLLSIENQSCFSVFSCKITRRITSCTASFLGRQKHRIHVCCIAIYLAPPVPVSHPEHSDCFCIFLQNSAVFQQPSLNRRLKNAHSEASWKHTLRSCVMDSSRQRAGRGERADAKQWRDVTEATERYIWI